MKHWAIRAALISTVSAGLALGGASAALAGDEPSHHSDSNFVYVPDYDDIECDYYDGTHYCYEDDGLLDGILDLDLDLGLSL